MRARCFWRCKIELVFEVDIDPRKFNDDENGHFHPLYEPLRYGFLLAYAEQARSALSLVTPYYPVVPKFHTVLIFHEDGFPVWKVSSHA